MKTVVITGASRGIGKAIAEKFANNGFRVVLGYNTNKEKAENFSKDLSVKTEAYAMQINLENEKSIDLFFKDIIDTFGKIDVFVNNAGISQKLMLSDASYETIDKVIKTNLTGPIYACKKAVENMLKFEEGHIVNISSIFGIKGGSCETIYSASKSGFTSFTSALAREVGPSGIYVNTIAPGAIDTDMNSDWKKDSKDEFFSDSAVQRIGKPEEIAEVVYFLSNENSSYINGQTIIVDGGKI